LFLLQEIEKNGWHKVIEGNLFELRHSTICGMFFDAISSVKLLEAKDLHEIFSLKPLERSDKVTPIYYAFDPP
jgi:hypothetical protein